MNKSIIATIAFAAGASTGSIAAWKAAKTKYQRKLDEETADMRERYSRRNAERKLEDDTDYETARKNLREELKHMKKEVKRSEESDVTAVDFGRNPIPYVIDSDQFGEIEGYETATLWWYMDEMLEDEDGNLIEDIDGMVGYESLECLGEDADGKQDTVYVRNEFFATDYEILYTPETYFYDGSPQEDE